MSTQRTRPGRPIEWDLGSQAKPAKPEPPEAGGGGGGGGDGCLPALGGCVTLLAWPAIIALQLLILWRVW